MTPLDPTRSTPHSACRKVLNPDDITEITGMALHWCDMPLVVESTARGLVIDVFGGCRTTLADTTYTLRKVLLFLPSVHQQGAQLAPLEVQFVHEADRQNSLLLAVMFREGNPGPEVDSAIASILSKHGTVRLINLVPLSRHFYIHSVSDQTGGMHREVHMIHATEMAISPAQIAALQARRSHQ